GVHVRGGEVGQLQAPDLGGAGIDRAGRAVPDMGFLPFRTTEVEGVHGDRAEHVVHDHVAHAHLLHHASAVPPGLQPDAPVGTWEDAVADGAVAHPAPQLPADHHPTVPVDHRAARDHDVLAGDALRGGLGAGLARDAVIADIDMAVADAHIAARLGV